jgi:hypothetical protein
MREIESGKNSDNELKTAYQYYAVVFMFMDHLGYLLSFPILRVFGRLAMPLYCLMFADTVRAGRVSYCRLLLLAVLSQIPYMIIFQVPRLNIIFGFLIFAKLVHLFETRGYLRFFSLVWMVLLPVDYGLYLYCVLLIFYLRKNKFYWIPSLAYSVVFAPIQLFSVLYAYLPKIELPRMNKYFYRVFYPLHLWLLALAKIAAVCCLFVLLGCAPGIKDIDVVKFKEVYQPLADNSEIGFQAELREKKYSFVAEGMPLKYFVRWLADVSGCSVVTSEEMDERTLTANIQEQNLDTILEFVSRRYSMQVIKTGSMYYVGELRSEDKGVLVRKVTKLTEEGLKQVVGNLLSEYGRCSTFPDGLIVVSDKIKVLNKINEMIDLLESTSEGSWCVQLYLISIRKNAEMKLGYNTTVSQKIVVDSFKSTSSPLVLNALLDLSASYDDIEIMAEPLFLLIDGLETKFYSGEEYPVPKKSVSSEGTVQTTGYEFIPVGLTISVSLREVSKTAARLSVNYQMGSVIGFVADVPITEQQTYKTSAICEQSGVYLLGSMDRKDRRKNIKGAIPVHLSTEKKEATIQVWARVFKIAKIQKDISIQASEDIEQTTKPIEHKDIQSDEIQAMRENEDIRSQRKKFLQENYKTVLTTKKSADIN